MCLPSLRQIWCWVLRIETDETWSCIQGCSFSLKEHDSPGDVPWMVTDKWPFRWAGTRLWRSLNLDCMKKKESRWKNEDNEMSVEKSALVQTGNDATWVSGAITSRGDETNRSGVYLHGRIKKENLGWVLSLLLWQLRDDAIPWNGKFRKNGLEKERHWVWFFTHVFLAT